MKKARNFGRSGGGEVQRRVGPAEDGPAENERKKEKRKEVIMEKR